MGFDSHSNGGKIQRYKSSRIQEYQCFESWNSEEQEWQKPHKLRMFQTHKPELFTINQLSMYGVSIWCGQSGFTEEEKEQRRPRGKNESASKNILSSVNNQDVKLLESSSRLASGSSLRRNIQDFESLSGTVRFSEGLRTRIVPAPDISWYKFPNST